MNQRERGVRCLDLLMDVLGWLGREFPDLRAELADVHVSVKVGLDEVDFARGATADLRGYFWGAPRVPPDQRDDGAGGACPDQLPRLPWETGPDAIVLFADKIEPLTRQEVARTFLHELGHLCGFDEWELTEGLGLS